METAYESYRFQAEYCERKAKFAPTPELRASWQRLAEEWLLLISPHDALMAPRGTQPTQRELV